MSPKRTRRTPTASQPEVIEISDSEAVYGEDEIQVLADAQPSPPSASKRKSGQDEEPSPSKRQRLPVRVRSSPSGRHSTLVVEIPFPRRSQRSKEEEVQDSQDEEGGDDGDEATEVFKTPMERKHVKFDDDYDHEEFVTPLERAAGKSSALSASQSSKLDDVAEAEVESVDDEEEESSDDDAPEAISSHHAAAQSAKLAQAAAKAAEQQVAEKKRKRRERDTLLKEQAETRKRALAELKEKAKASEEADAAALQSEIQKAQADGQRKRRLEIPDVLPPEFLESDDEDEEEREAGNVSQPRKNKKIKFSTVEKRLAREDRAPRDERVGSTVYRVVADKRDPKLAPKLGKQSRNLKEQLLRRHRVPQARRGFLVKG